MLWASVQVRDSTCHVFGLGDAQVTVPGGQRHLHSLSATFAEADHAGMEFLQSRIEVYPAELKHKPQGTKRKCDHDPWDMIVLKMVRAD